MMAIFRFLDTNVNLMPSFNMQELSEMHVADHFL